MAGLSTKAIKNRIKSMQSTRQITKAMELVAASKLRSAQAKAISSRPYFQTLYAAMDEIADTNNDFSSPYLHANPDGKPVYVVTESYAEAASVSIGDCYTIAKMLADGFLDGSFGKLTLGYTNFVSMLSQTPSTLDLLPLRVSTEKRKTQNAILYEPGSEAVFNAIVPEYLGGVLYGALCESTASEQAARRTAMDSATKNADEIIDDLNLRYNRARQGAITQEITEIVAGAEQS